MMRDKRFIKNLKIMIEIIIDLNDKLYKCAIKQRHTERHFGRAEDYVNNFVFKIKTKASRNQRQNKTIFMKLNTILFKKFKNQKKNFTNRKKRYDVLRM